MAGEPNPADQHDEAATEKRFTELVKRLLNTPPQHKPAKKGRPEDRPQKPKRPAARS